MHVRVVSVLFASAAWHGVAVANLPDSLDTRSVNQPGGRRFTGIASGIARRLAICPFAIAQSVQYATDLAFCADIAYIACLDLSCTVNAADTVACCKNAYCRCHCGSSRQSVSGALRPVNICHGMLHRRHTQASNASLACNATICGVGRCYEEMNYLGDTLIDCYCPEHYTGSRCGVAGHHSRAPARTCAQTPCRE